MCGICGQLFFDSRKKVQEAIIQQMCDSIRHRGPDEEGIHVDGNFGMGIRRLRVIDLETGRQPISNEDESLWIVFNGEIYNYRSLRRELEQKGHQFSTRSDTEVILHAYETFGEACPEKLNGMFAFAIWDSRRDKLFLARDRLGIKPLYYYCDTEKLIFGSEIKAILRCHNVHKAIDLLALNNFLTFEYIPSPRSIFQEVRKLEPGHWLSWEKGEIRRGAYWELEVVPRDIDESEAGEHLRELLLDSVRLRLVSDVPLGAFLSGGVDSSIVVALMANLVDQPVKTFSIGFKESSYNELAYARAVAKRYNTDHHEFVLEPDVLDLTEKLIGHFDEPFGDFSIFPTYLVSKMARDHVTVALSGDGGDELFAGYDTYRAHRFDRRYFQWWPKVVKRNIFEPIASVLPPTSQKKGFINSFKRFVEGAKLPESLRHVRWMVFLQEEERRALFSPEVWRHLQHENSYDFILAHSAAASGVDDVSSSGYIDVKSYLADDILVKVDRMSMATSLEARVPYLDHRLVEFSFTLPPNLKLNGFRTKYLLRRCMVDLIPPIVKKRDKQGFSIPIKNWIREALKPMMLDLLDEGRLRRESFFNTSYVATMVDEHLRGIENHSHLLWALMVFEQWYDIYGKKA